MQTFYHNLKSRDNTVILIKDFDNYIFGAYCSEEWQTKQMPGHVFFGNGENFVFSFHTGYDIFYYPWNMCEEYDEEFQYSDFKSIIIGGGNK